jgi:hypothetical protein
MISLELEAGEPVLIERNAPPRIANILAQALPNDPAALGLGSRFPGIKKWLSARGHGHYSTKIGIAAFRALINSASGRSTVV